MMVILIIWLGAWPDDCYSNLLTWSVTWWLLFQSFDLERDLMIVILIFWLGAWPDDGYSNLFTWSV